MKDKKLLKKLLNENEEFIILDKIVETGQIEEDNQIIRETFRYFVVPKKGIYTAEASMILQID